MSNRRSAQRIAIVGPCASGKTTLAHALQSLGWQAHQVAQEHSFAPSMWERLTQPDVLIYLDASFEICSLRKRLDWHPKDYSNQIHRLKHARQHCQIYVNTDNLQPEEVLDQVLSALSVANHVLPRV